MRLKNAAGNIYPDQRFRFSRLEKWWAVVHQNIGREAAIIIIPGQNFAIIMANPVANVPNGTPNPIITPGIVALGSGRSSPACTPSRRPRPTIRRANAPRLIPFRSAIAHHIGDGRAKGTSLSAPSPSPESREYHLNYEIWMLEETNQKHHDTDQVINNALIESFCVHARNLIEFFAEEARHYTTQSYRPFCHISRKRLESIRGKINVQISHVKYQGRTTNDADKITARERAEIINILAAEISEFKAHLLPKYGQSEIRDLRPLTVSISFATPPGGANVTTVPSSVSVVYFPVPPHRSDC
jgi:hypothetical protein